MGGSIVLCAQWILRRWRHMVALSELLALISIAFGFLPKHNSEYTTQKFSVEGQQEKQCKTSDKKRRTILRHQKIYIYIGLVYQSGE